MGDLLYVEHTLGKRDLSDVVEMYKEAALKNNPQVSLGPTYQSVLALMRLFHLSTLTAYVRCRFDVRPHSGTLNILEMFSSLLRFLSVPD